MFKNKTIILLLALNSCCHLPLGENSGPTVCEQQLNLCKLALQINSEEQEMAYIDNKDVWTFTKNTKGEWRWKRKSSNGKIVGASTESYKRKKDCVANAVRNGFKVKKVKKVEAVEKLVLK